LKQLCLPFYLEVGSDAGTGRGDLNFTENYPGLNKAAWVIEQEWDMVQLGRLLVTQVKFIFFY
jgi:hypothetical protein